MFLDIAEMFAKKSHCVSFQVAAVAVRNGRILYTGINGTPSGYMNCDDYHNQEGYDWKNLEPVAKRECHHKWSLIHEGHSEQALISGCAKEGISLKDADIYVTHQPCRDCMKLIVLAGIKKIIFRHAYDKADPESIQFARKCGVEVICLSI